MVPTKTLIISVKEARKLLGRDYSVLKDEQVETIITLLHKIALGNING
jgi:hypothetical protein